MQIYIKSNFIIPGLRDEGRVEVGRSQMTLKEFLDELSMMSPTPVEYVEPGAKTLNPDDWEVEINHVPYQNFSQGLETLLKDGDIVSIRILALGGG